MDEVCGGIDAAPTSEQGLTSIEDLETNGERFRGGAGCPDSQLNGEGQAKQSLNIYVPNKTKS
jgi:hypothetical protein